MTGIFKLVWLFAVLSAPGAQTYQERSVDFNNLISANDCLNMKLDMEKWVKVDSRFVYSRFECVQVSP